MKELGEKSKAFHLNMKPIIEDANIRCSLYNRKIYEKPQSSTFIKN